MEDPRRASKLSPVFVDADAFVALAREDDTNHSHALRILQFLSRQSVGLITSNYVFAEAVTVISQRVGHQAALSFIEEVRSPESTIFIDWIYQEIESRAMQIFAKQTSKNVSFVDCTNMAILERGEIDHIFSFDAAYRKNGYHLVQELMEK